MCIEANQKSIPIWPASALAASLPPPDLKPRLPRLQDPMPPFSVSAFAPQSQGPPKETQTKPLAQQQRQQQQRQQGSEQQETDFLTLLTLLEKALRHTHYAVCGRAALYVWGYRHPSSDAPPEQVSILCPEGDAPIILSWAKAQGWTSNVVSSVKGCCSFEVPIPERDGKYGGKVRTVVVKTTERMGGLGGTMGAGMPMTVVKGTWAEAEKKVLKTQAAVVSLPALLEMLMEGFVTAVTHTHTHTHQQQGQQQQQQHTHQVEESATAILWVLSRLVERGERLFQDQVPEEFLTPFLTGWPESHALLQKLGVSPTFEALDRDGDRDDELHQRPGLPLDTVTLAALEEGLQAPAPPVLLPVRKASPAFSCASASSEDTIALIEDEIVSWQFLSLEQQSVETGSSLGSGVDSSAAELSGIWTPAGSCPTVASSVSSIPTLSFSAYSACSSNESGTRSSRRRSIKRVCVPPPWKSGWNESFVGQREYPEWI
ncbi:hypothetical protein NEUTE1DRAFT_141955 [Neurospora tetrasperma FGSC 2508]|uniref:Uncharacterized protein n=1 Tax=Neurospora tetrasperma (strain FGSC 2508 / ATCC MYA-4615 / P0657) TaxID=510951 RepID=F8MZR1_NEUT8|nr:uncharacterized protein NEUTE1DRAFT_141955 [Neurospora tetrasperma FGSC 2508]EGO52048.1 hypothetical protein NEUTE1DRAFT_141955 [Neurospora tetrasperma FGSC 2508]